MQSDAGVEGALSNNDLLSLYLCIYLPISLIQPASLQETEVEPKEKRKKENIQRIFSLSSLPKLGQ